MSITDQIRTRLSDTLTRTSFACEGCGLTFERDHLNCPACGCVVREVTDTRR